MVVMVLVGCISIDFSYAKEKKTAKKTSQKMNQPTYDTKPFDLSVSKLPPNYMGHNIAKLYFELEKKFPPKDEFERQESYINRIQSFKPTDLYAFAIETYPSNSHYNAEKQTLGVSFNIGKYFGNDSSRWGKELANVRTISHKVSEEKYIGSNAYGAKAVVKKREHWDFGIAFSNVQLVSDKYLKLERNYMKHEVQEGSVYVIRGGEFYEITGYKIDINISPDEAKNLKENLGVLLICIPKASKNNELFYKRKDYSRATIDWLYETTTIEHVIFVKVLEMWVYDIKNGQIYAKQKMAI